MSNRFKLALAAVTVAGAFSVPSSSSASGIPVFDAAGVAQAVQQLTQLEQQYQQMVQQYNAVTGIRGFGDLLKNPALRSYLPQQWQGVYDDVKRLGYSGLSGTAQTIRDANAIYSCQGQTGQALAVCQQAAYKPAQDQAFMKDAYAAAMNRVSDMQSLIDQINTTQDPKAIAELQARIEGEQVAVQNEQVKLNLFKMLSDAQDKMLQQQQRELSLKETAKRDRTATTLSPVAF
jgi:type IV secretion system protein VirB5